VTLIIPSDPDVGEVELLDGKLSCPSCNGVLRPSGHARSRTIRMCDGLDRSMLDNGFGVILLHTEDKVFSHGHVTLSVPGPAISITCPVPECGRWIRSIKPASRYSSVSPMDTTLMRTSMPESSSVSRGSNSLWPVGRRLQSSEQQLGARLVWTEPEHQGRCGSGNRETGCIIVFYW